MGANCFKDLLGHVGHKIRCVTYGDGNLAPERQEDAENVALECETCGMVLLDFNRTPPQPLWNPDSAWDYHPNYTRADWGYEANNNDTNLGYADWVNHQLEMKAQDEKDDAANGS